MKFTQVDWLKHADDRSEKKPLVSISAVSPSPDGRKIVTGGLDTKIRIWETSAILDAAVDAQADSKRLLYTGTAHNGSVMCVRWSNSGRYIASGADDRIVAIWEIQQDNTGSGKVWGSSDVNVENWKAIRLLPGHENDILSVAWSDDDAFLATGGVDTLVLIWDGATFAPIRKLAVHTGFVKGLAFDPSGQFLASQSDDDTLKIWNTNDWSLAADVTDPFTEAPNDSANWFLRPSWSPDGTFIVTPNSMNGPVFVAGVVDRGNRWKSNTCFVGHQNIVTVAAFNPLVFLSDPSKPVSDGKNVSSIIALAARSSVSIWASAYSHPLMVFHDVFTRDILDLQWSHDGKTLWASSSDGHVGAFQFEFGEFGEHSNPAPAGAKEQFHREKWAFVRPVRASHPLPFASNNAVMIRADPLKPPEPQKTTIMANGKRRIQPSFISGGQTQTQVTTFQEKQSSTPVFPGITTAASVNTVKSVAAPVASTAATFAHANAAPAVSPSKKGASTLPPLPQQSQASVERLFASSHQSRDSMPPNLETDFNQNKTKHNRTVRGPTLGGNREREKRIVVEEIAPAFIPKEGSSTDMRLAVPAIQSFLKIALNDVVDVDADASSAIERLEIRNFRDGLNRPSEIALVGPGGAGESEKIMWVDYREYKVATACWSGAFGAVSAIDGSLTIYSATGRRLGPPLMLDAPCSYLDAAGSFLMAITARGRLHLWNVNKMTAVFSPLQVLDILMPLPNSDSPVIKNARVRPNGALMITMDDGRVLSYDTDLLTWTTLSSRWWSKGSEVWEGRTRGKSTATGRGILRAIEGITHDMVVDERHGSFYPAMDVDDNTNVIGEEQQKLGQEGDWKTAMSLAHLETRLSACELLDSPVEYRTQLMLYAARLASEGFRSKAEEFVRSLMGPIY